MTEQYDVICLVNGDKIESRLFLDEEGERYQDVVDLYIRLQ